MRLFKCFVVLALMALQQQGFGWSSQGHQLIAEIAVKNLTPKAKTMLLHANHGLDPIFPSRDLVESAIWMDEIRTQGIKWFDALHYIDLGFTTEDIPVPKPHAPNAVWAIQNAAQVLKNYSSPAVNRALSVRILLHVIGDLHQPLHAASRLSAQHPKGDLGGNLFPLGRNPVANNLHSYWDRGAGLFPGWAKASRKTLKTRLMMINEQWACDVSKMDTNPEHWAQESHDLAVKYAYSIKPNEAPSKNYQAQAQELSKQRIALAGCRMAAFLNEVAEW